MSIKKPILTYEQKQLVLGTLLGDAGLHRRTRNGHDQLEFYISHGLDQKDYIEYIANLLGVKVGTYHKGQKSFGAGEPYLRFSYGNKPELSKIFELCFKDGKKTITDEWLEQVDAPAIAYWFMDDGSSSFDIAGHKTVMVRFATQCFSKQENLCLMEKLLEFGIQSTLRKVVDGTGYNIYVRQNSVNKLMDLIEPYIVTDDLKYKIKRRETLPRR